MDPDRWYAFEAGRQLGPMSWIALKARADSGLLRGEDFVWQEGMPDWVPVHGVDGLLEVRPPPFLGSVSTELPSDSSGEARASDVPALVFAGFWRRAAAYAIDGAILLVSSFVVGFSAGLMLTMFGMKPSGSVPGWNVFGIIVFWLYFAGQESSKYRATLGKRVLGIQVVDLRGQRIDFARASGRHFGKILSTIFAFTGFLMAAFTSRKQALHDVMASCLVVRGRSSEAAIPDHEAWANRHWGEARSQPTDGAQAPTDSA